jgi:hypothetical protein
MSKKDLQSLTTNLAELAERMPSQNVERKEKAEKGRASTPTTTAPKIRKPPPPVEERDVQYSFSLRQSLRKELARLAQDNDMTIRAFILDALKEKGLSVRKEDLLDLRKRRG